MKCNPEQLHEHLDGTLPAPETAVIEAHLAACPACRAELASLQRLRAATAELPRELAPTRDLWPAISAQLASPVGPALRRRPEFPPRAAAAPVVHLPASAFRLSLVFAAAAAIAVLCTFFARHASLASRQPAWSVVAMDGAPHLAARPIARDTPFHVGQWLETDATSRAKVAVGSIGEVRVEPNSRVRLVGATANDHRIQLARGTVDALIWAPPRLFFVDTPSATAVDLGCAYTLTTDDNGNSELHVTAGYVALEHPQRRAIVSRGLKCHTRRDVGPGLPFDPNADSALLAAVEAFDFGPRSGRDPAFATILARARATDEVTLWHLLGRTVGEQRGAAFDALARFRPPPPGVTRAGILAGDRAMRRAWGFELGLGPF